MFQLSSSLMPKHFVCAVVQEEQHILPCGTWPSMLGSREPRLCSS